MDPINATDCPVGHYSPISWEDEQRILRLLNDKVRTNDGNKFYLIQRSYNVLLLKESLKHFKYSTRTLVSFCSQRLLFFIYRQFSDSILLFLSHLSPGSVSLSTFAYVFTFLYVLRRLDPSIDWLLSCFFHGAFDTCFDIHGTTLHCCYECIATVLHPIH